MNVETWREQIRIARESYKPDIIRCLLIAEAPPDEPERFFYYPEVKTADFLFLGIMDVLYPTEKSLYIKKKRPKAMKQELLRRFKEDGFYLEDLLSVPKSIASDEEWRVAPEQLISRIKNIIRVDTPIILIKANVFDKLHKPLSEAGFSVIQDKSIPFPSSGQQKVFADSFKRELIKVQL
jgi:hypothetical protein